MAAGRVGQWRFGHALRSLVRPNPIDEIAAALNLVGIGDKIWERTDRLSGGEQQRVAIARTLFQAPDIVLADEPVSALDPARSDAVMATLVKAASISGKAIIASMHDAPLALVHCDRIIGVRQGRLSFDKPAEQVTDALLDQLYAFDQPGAVDPTTAS